MLEKLKKIEELKKEVVIELLMKMDLYQVRHGLSYIQMAKLCGLNWKSFSNMRSRMRLHHIFPSKKTLKKLKEAGIIEGEL